MINPDLDTIHIEAAVYRRLIEHLLHECPDIADRELMSVAGFSRERLAQWYREAAQTRGITMSDEEARQSVFAMPWQPDGMAEAGSSSVPPDAGRC